MLTLEIDTDDAQAIHPDARTNPGGFHMTCLCGCEIVTLVTVGRCSCGRMFDITAWGK